MIVVVQLGELGEDGNGDALRKGSDSGADQSARNGREGGLILGERNLLESTDTQRHATPMYRGEAGGHCPRTCPAWNINSAS